jgi:DNA-binding beta-propeller fold protein YncE
VTGATDPDFQSKDEAMTAVSLRLAILAISAMVACSDARTRIDEESALGVAAGEAGTHVQQPACRATHTSLTPADWKSPPVEAAADAPRGALRVVADVPLPGPANRFDYQSVDPARGRLYISHMDAGSVVVFDLDSSRVVSDVPGTRRATGVLAVPSHHAVYVSAAGAHQVVVIDDRTFATLARVSDVRFPDGIAYAPAEDKAFVSDESGEADVVIDAKTSAKRSTIALGGEAGNTHYDSVSHCILVAVQTRNQLVAIDPATERIVERYELQGSDHPHGFAIDEPGRIAYVTGEGNATLQVVDLRTMRIAGEYRVGDDPDVVAWDPAWRRLYVASESGVVSAFLATGSRLQALGVLHIPHAHSVAVDPRTHRVYLPLENVGGHPLMRILVPDR